MTQDILRLLVSLKILLHPVTVTNPEYYHLILQFPSTTQSLCSICQLIVLVFPPAASLFWFALTALVVSFLVAAGGVFHEKALKTTCMLPARHQTAGRQSSHPGGVCPLGIGSEKRVNAGLIVIRWSKTQL